MSKEIKSTIEEEPLSSKIIDSLDKIESKEHEMSFKNSNQLKVLNEIILSHNEQIKIKKDEISALVVQ